MKTIGLFIFLLAAAAPSFAQTPPLKLDKAPLLDAPGPGYRDAGPGLGGEVKTVKEMAVPDVAWTVYEPKSLPAGKRLSIPEAARLEEGFKDKPPVYLKGDFVVAAAASDRAVLRDQRDPGLARIVAIYPKQFTPPVEGSKFSRDEARPFQIQNVRRSADGIVTIYVRDVMSRAEESGENPTPVAPYLDDKRR